MKKSILIFGDSNTWGWKPENGEYDPPQRWEDEVRWPGVLQSELGEAYKVIADGLNGRTSVWDDPLTPFRRGADQILPVMQSHSPLDLLVIALGTNDLKVRFCATARDIARGAAALVTLALGQREVFTGAPRVLLIAPPPLGSLDRGMHRFTFDEAGVEKSRRLGPLYGAAARSLGAAFLDAGKVIKSSDTDGLHLDPDQHALLGRAVAENIRDLGL
ncbi:MAG: SGNH/GDSL hydrolase family protein [Treponema sp.]|jgi:lysophospholipase L1-like esterase|nr:SGNH/GDSL hydrolase family protein [Treponema sp.]